MQSLKKCERLFYLLQPKLFITALSKAPNSFTVTVKTSTSVTASWQLPPADSRNGITGFKVFLQKERRSGVANHVTY